MSRKVKYSVDGGIFEPSQITDVLEKSVNKYSLFGNKKGVYYYNVPCCLDIETSSFYKDATGKQYTYEQVSEIRKRDKKAEFKKVANMYVWQLGINGNIIIGRTWDEFGAVMECIKTKLGLNENRRLVIYIHNLSYEFQFIRKRFKWESVFSTDKRKPLYARTTDFIEFRCSYLLSGYGLSTLGKQLLKYPVEKKTGDLDYRLIRHSETPLNDVELGYCVNDVRVVMSYIQELIEEYRSITNIPLTKTGFVRRYCRKNCLTKDNKDGKKQLNYKYYDLMRELQINDLKEFQMLQRAFQGGFTHANGYYADNVIENVSSFDFTSSYPYVMVAEQFPMSRGVKIDKVKSKEQFNFYLSKYCCVFDIIFENLMACKTNDNPLSASKLWFIEDEKTLVKNNGRVVSCMGQVATTITNVDYDILKEYYTWEKAYVGNMYCYRKGYLPTEFVKSILDLYQKKTTLKGVDGKENEYLNSKEMLNSCYGMSVTNPLRDECYYDDTDEWCLRTLQVNSDLSTDCNNKNIKITHVYTEEEQEDFIYKYNNSRNRFLFYPWGIFITAYARRNLFTAISECKDDYVYSDTDSVKIKNIERHKDYFDKYNKDVESKLLNASKFHGFDFDLCRPKTMNGKEKMLGVWDYEGTYRRFKTLGAKRYMVEYENALNVGGKSYDFSLTVSGVDKRTAIPYLIDTYGADGIFDAFTNYLYLPEIGCGKNIHAYIDEPTEGQVTDYNGVVSGFKELSAVHLEPSDYTLSLDVLYLNFLMGRTLKD